MNRIAVAAVLASAGLMAVPAGSSGAVTNFKFGAKLNREPDNSSPAHKCSDDFSDLQGACTRVLVSSETGLAGGNLTSPHDGTLTKFKVRSGAPGSVRFQLVRLKNLSSNNGSAQGKARTKSKVFQIQGHGFDATNQIETFKVNMKVKKGDYVAILSSKTGAERCTSGSNRQLLFAPPLQPGDPFRSSDAAGNCTLMVQALGHT
ncbi:MAG: hypothetical protein E6G53_00465 [Actinobacteria bacterium]|nr:MAG: hypothetical protein E6G53_00465 [Actinomycetota bacterium]